MTQPNCGFNVADILSCVRQYVLNLVQTGTDLNIPPCYIYMCSRLADSHLCQTLASLTASGRLKFDK